MILGASYSVDILNPSFFYKVGLQLHDLTLLSDERLRRRLLLSHPETDLPFELDGEWWQVKDFFRHHGWDVNRDCDYTHIGCVFVDEDYLFLLDPGIYGHPSEIRMHSIEGRQLVSPYQKYYEALWNGYQNESILWDDVVFPGFPESSQKIAIASNDDWNRIIKYLSQHPEILYELTPRKFEELIAELLHREGYNITLTPERKDGGFDILALHNTAVGRHLYLVECKRYARENPVGVNLVRALYGVVENERASGGLIVTTSRFTRGALEFQHDLEFRVNLKQYENIKEWLAIHSAQ